MQLQTFHLQTTNHIAHLKFSRPHKANALNQQAWEEMKTAFDQFDQDPDVRVVVLSGEGRHFCAGIDLELLVSIGDLDNKGCPARKREKFMHTLQFLQDCISSIEKCRKPVLAAIHNGCIGGGVDIVSACDMRYCTEDAYFTIKEVDMGLVADIGTMQRLPKIIPYGIAAEMAYTGRKVPGKEAAETGLVNRVFGTKEKMMDEVMTVASTIAAKSPLVIRGTKHILQYTRDHSVAEGLQYMKTWNAAMVFSDDLLEAFQATMQKRKPVFEG